MSRNRGLHLAVCAAFLFAASLFSHPTMSERGSQAQSVESEALQANCNCPNCCYTDAKEDDLI